MTDDTPCPPPSSHHLNDGFTLAVPAAAERTAADLPAHTVRHASPNARRALFSVLLLAVFTAPVFADSDGDGDGTPHTDRILPLKARAHALSAPAATDRTTTRLHCLNDAPCTVQLECAREDDETLYLETLSEPIAPWGTRVLSADDIDGILGFGLDEWTSGRIECNVRSNEAVTAQVWTRSSDGTLVNTTTTLQSEKFSSNLQNSLSAYSVPVFSIPSSNSLNTSHLRIRCDANMGDCTDNTLRCVDTDGRWYPDRYEPGVIEGSIPAGTVRSIQPADIEEIIGHTWSGRELSCFVGSQQPLSAQILTRTGGGALVNNSALSGWPVSTPTNPPTSAPAGCDLIVERDRKRIHHSLATASFLGNLTEATAVRARRDTMGQSDNIYRFTLDDTRMVRLHLRKLTRNGALTLLNSLGKVRPATNCNPYDCRSNNEGTSDEVVTATLSAGTYYIRVNDASDSTADTEYELRYSNESRVPGRSLESAFDLGDMTNVPGVLTRAGRVNRTKNEIDVFREIYYQFTLDDTRTVRFHLRKLTRNADLTLLNSLGKSAAGYHCNPYDCRSNNEGNSDEVVTATLSAGTYYVRVRAASNSKTDAEYELDYP